MRTLRIHIFLMALCLLLPGSLFAQNPHELYIPQPTGGQYLNDLIMADSLTTGGRVDSLRVYVLQRGAVYLLNTSIRNTNWALRIKAKDTAGTKPIVFMVRNTTTSTNPGQFVDVRGNVYLKNLIISGFLEADTSTMGNMPGALLTTNTAGWTIVVDSCILTNSSGNHIRTTSAARAVKVYNTLFANMGYLGTSNFGAGKAFDLRDASCDTLWVQNCTFVNGQDRIIRHRASTASIKYLMFDHNTIVNNLSYHGNLALGWLGRKVSITNNLFVDPFAFGNDTDATRQAEFDESGEKDQYGFARMTWVLSVKNDTTIWQVKNNYYSISTEGQNWLTTNGLTVGSPLTWHINSKLGADSVNAFRPLSLTLTKVPALPTRMMTWYRTPAAQGGAGKTKATTNWNKTYDYNRAGWMFLRDTLKCTYPTTSAAYTGAMGGYPVGDLNWWPSRKNSWLIYVTDARNQENVMPQQFSLNQNYPNPFNPSTTISFSLTNSAMTTLSVYNLLGQRVSTLVSQPLQAGNYEYHFDGTNLASGIYYYQLESGNSFAVKKMIMMK